MSFYTAMVKIPKKKEPKNSSIKYFTKEEVCIILSAPNANTLTGQRDITLLSVLYATGARAQELCDITIKDISFSDPTRIKADWKREQVEDCHHPPKLYGSVKGLYEKPWILFK